MKPGAPGKDLPVPPPRGVRRRRRKSARLAAAVGLLALAGTALYSPAAATAATAASSGKANATAASTAVLDGNARFEVLTPTLIRLEYAGDGAFQDADDVQRGQPLLPGAVRTRPTSAPTATARSHTSALTLRYKQGSGPFTAGEPVDHRRRAPTRRPRRRSRPTARSAPPARPRTRCSAGRGDRLRPHRLHRVRLRRRLRQATGSGIQQDVSAVPAAGTYRLSVRYANATGGDGQNATRTLSTTVNGAAGPTLSLPATALVGHLVDGVSVTGHA